MPALDAAIGPRCAGQVRAAAYRPWPPAADRDRWPGNRGEEQANCFRPGTWRLRGPWVSIPLPDLQSKEPICAGDPFIPLARRLWGSTCTHAPNLPEQGPGGLRWSRHSEAAR